MIIIYNIFGYGLFCWWGIIRWYVLRNETWLWSGMSLVTAVIAIIFFAMALTSNISSIIQNKVFFILGLLLIYRLSIDTYNAFIFIPDDPIKWTIFFIIDLLSLSFVYYWVILCAHNIYNTNSCIIGL
jgi:predicted membrane protein